MEDDVISIDISESKTKPSSKELVNLNQDIFKLMFPRRQYIEEIILIG